MKNTNVLKKFAEEIKKIDEKKPTEKWKCDVCGTMNDNWIPKISDMLKGKDISFMRGDCPNCERIRLTREKERNIEIEKDNAKRKTISLLKKSNIPPKIIDSRFDDLDCRDGAELAFKALKRLENADRWIYIHGPNNTGKSMLIGAAINMLSKKHIPSFYFHEQKLFTRIKASYNYKNTENAFDIFGNIYKSKIIFWDDFSVLPYGNHDFGIVNEILEICDSDRKIIVFTSNVNLPQGLKNDKEVTEERIGKRQLGRIKRNNTYFIEMKNKPFF